MKAFDVIRERVPERLLAPSLAVSFLLNIGMLIALLFIYNHLDAKDRQISQLKSWVSYMDVEVSSKKKELTGLKHDLERIRREREKLGLSNDSINRHIEDLKATISRLESKTRLSDRERSGLEKLIAKLKRQIVEKDRQIADLILQNDSLFTDVSNLRSEKIVLNRSLDSTKSILALASVLKAENIEVLGVRENGREMDRDEYKGKKLDQIKVTFSLADNRIASKGRKAFYVSITTPEGKVFSDFYNGGGSIRLKSGEEVPYTMQESVIFNNKNERVSLTMLKGFNYVPGEYKIAVYSEGFKIGEGGFFVK